MSAVTYRTTPNERFSTTRQSSCRPLSSRTHGWFESAGISLDTLATRRVSHVEPWRMKGLCYDLSLLQHFKSSTLAEELKQLASINAAEQN